MTKTIDKKNTITIITSIVLAFAIILTSVILYDWEEDPILIKALGTIATDVVLGTVMIVLLGVSEAFICIKYNQYWIRHHSKDEIIARYGAFDHTDYRNGSYVGFYKTGDISDVSFYAVAIYFDQEGNVESINMNSSYGLKGG